jgi:hypothetical protein
MPFRRHNLQANLNSLHNRPRHNQAASVRIHERGIALLGKGFGGMQTGQQYRNFKRQSRTAANRVLCLFRSAHKLAGQTFF